MMLPNNPENIKKSENDTIWIVKKRIFQTLNILEIQKKTQSNQPIDEFHPPKLIHLDRLRSPLRLRAGTIPPSLPMQNDLEASQLPPVAICHRLDRCFFFQS